MSENNRLKNSIIWILRWILYIPIIVIVTGLVQTLTAYISNFPWWIALAIWTFLGIGPAICGGSVFASGLICPNRKFGNFLFLGLFTVLEIFAFTSEFGLNTAIQNILRFSSDFYIVFGFIFAALYEVNNEKSE